MSEEPTTTPSGRIVKKRHPRGGRQDLQIAHFAKIYMEEHVNHRNTITQEEFARYMPLFNKAMLSKLSEEQRANLGYEYSLRINQMEPVYVIDSKELDPIHGAFWLTDRQRHKVIFKLPAARPRLATVNELGPQASQYAAELMANTTKTAGPFDKRSRQYSEALAELIDKANEKGVAQQQKEFDDTVEKLRETVGASRDRTDVPEKDLLKPSIPAKKAEDDGLDIDWGD